MILTQMERLVIDGTGTTLEQITRIEKLTTHIHRVSAVRSFQSLFFKITAPPLGPLNQFVDCIDIKAGPQALETYDWARAAGMQSFQTFWDRCKQVLRDPDSWPKGVTFVNYPANDPKDDFRVSKPWVSKP